MKLKLSNLCPIKCRHFVYHKKLPSQNTSSLGAVENNFNDNTKEDTEEIAGENLINLENKQRK